MNSSSAPNLELVAGALEAQGFVAEAALARQAEGSQERLAELDRQVRRIKDRVSLPARIDAAEALLRLLLAHANDVNFSRTALGPIPILLVHIQSITDRKLLQQTLSALSAAVPSGGLPPAPQLTVWVKRHATLGGVTTQNQLAKAVDALLNGSTLLFLDGSPDAVDLPTFRWEKRPVEEPNTERVIRGPREGFSESIEVNVALLRRRVRDERLCLETKRIGEVTGTEVTVAYVRGICKQSLIDEVWRRLGRIKTDAIIDSGYIEEFIEDTPYTVFPQLKTTERPDVVAASLAEGRFAILVEGSPFALIAPTFLLDMLQAPDDYYERFPIAVLLRTLRSFFAFVSLTAPSIYVALTSFHPQIVPTQLLISILATREGVPFPAVIEALMMELAFEALREAGLRMPQPMGQAVSIAGGLVIGQAAVQAGVVSPFMVIIVAITGIASFVVPKVSAAVALRLLRFPLLLLSGSFGLYGLALGMIAVTIHVLTLRSFGVPYVSPLGPFLPQDQGDALVRLPHWAMRRRPAGVEVLDPVRVAPGLAPGPRHRKGGS